MRKRYVQALDLSPGFSDLFCKMGVLDVMDILNGRRYDPVKHCIYCGATDNLQKEHILPFRLSGTAVLPDSTCSKCASITDRQEGLVLRGPMRAVRVYRDLKSRSRHKGAPKEYSRTIMRGSVQETVMLPLDEYPIWLHFPIFPPPAFLNPSGYTNGIRIKGTATVSFGPKPAEVSRNLGATSISLTQDLYLANEMGYDVLTPSRYLLLSWLHLCSESHCLQCF